MVGTAATRAPGRRTSPAAAREHSQEPPPHRDWRCSWPATWRSGSGDAEPVRAGDMEPADGSGDAKPVNGAGDAEPVGGAGDAELVQRAGEGRWGCRGLGERAGAGRPREAPPAGSGLPAPHRAPWTCRGQEGLGSPPASLCCQGVIAARWGVAQWRPAPQGALCLWTAQQWQGAPELTQVSRGAVELTPYHRLKRRSPGSKGSHPEEQEL